jgi:glutathione S-transferase
MKLYSLPLSPYAARVRGSIYAKDLSVEIVTPPADWRTSPEYRALNPLVRIPVLVLDDGATIPESDVIVEYLEDAFPQPSLRPPTAKELARVRLITQVADLYVMQAVMPLFYLYDAKTRDEAEIEAQMAKLEDGLKQLDRLLVPGKLAAGTRLTTADVWLTPVRFTLAGFIDFSRRAGLLDNYPAIAAYADVARAEPSLGRVWREMEGGLEILKTTRAAAAS